MIKGHVAIELHNHHSGFRERIEGDNLITNALNYVINNIVGAGKDASYVMPLCKKTLGGIMLFDNPLTEDKSNIFFPSEAHLLAYAGRTVNTDSIKRGSLNVSETYETDTGFVSTWDFNTSQANGSIRSLGLTFAENGEISNPFCGYWSSSMHQAISTGGSASQTLQPLCYDMENQILYYIGISEGNSQTNRYDSSERVYYYTTNCTIYKEYIPTNIYGLADAANQRHYPEEVTTFSIERKGNSSNIAYYFFNGYDGYAYLVASASNNSGDGTFTYWTLKLSDYSFELSEMKTVTARSCHFNNRLEVVSKGYAYIRSYDMKSIYIVELANPVNILQATLPEGYNLLESNLTVLKNGGVRFLCRGLVDDGSSGHYNQYCGICYPDSKIVIDSSPYYTWDRSTMFSNYNPYGLLTDGLLVFGRVSDGYMSYGYQCNNYLGSIFNLGSPIVKTAASSMKVVYTLTNVDE